MKLDLKIIDDRLVIDLGKMKDDYSESYGYDGLASFYDVGELGCAEAVAQVELSQSQIDAIMAEYEGGGECDWCDEVAEELSGPHQMDFMSGEKMCRNCWELDRKTYKGSVGVDIGEFVATK